MCAPSLVPFAGGAKRTFVVGAVDNARRKEKGTFRFSCGRKSGIPLFLLARELPFSSAMSRPNWSRMLWIVLALALIVAVFAPGFDVAPTPANDTIRVARR